jgi:hypothetical protein
MLFSSNLTTDQLHDAFVDEVVARGGRVTDTYNDGRRLWTRSLLERADDVRPGDRVQGGVALKADDEEVRVYPYVFRQVCSNGAIVAETLGSLAIDEPEYASQETVLASIREAVAACCSPDVFAGNVRRMRDAQADTAINTLPMLAHLRKWGREELVSLVMKELFRQGDQTRFGLANAVTAVARETAEPELRWDLEELGGGIACGILPQNPSDRGQARAKRSPRLVGVR